MSEPRFTVVIAGHVDHGKTALTTARTGVDTDRLPEERRRGLSIQPGFADLELPSGRRLSVVDVPGHERFVRHMIAGASGVDGAILCVAADDRIMPQTREHLDALRLLGVPVLAVAVTFADRADPALASADAEALGVGPAIPVAAPRGVGLTELSEHLDRAVPGLRRRAGEGPPRLPVDRCFTVSGAGTVVTGTLWGGEFARGDWIRVEPGGRSGRVRRLEVHDRERERAVGGRVALNVAGVERDAVPRGSTIVRENDGWSPVDRLIVDLEHLASSPRALRGRERLQAFLGTAEVPARLRLLGSGRPLPPGGTGPVELRLESAVVVAPGDPVILRSADPTTVAGGIVRAFGEQPIAAAGKPRPRLRERPRPSALDAVAVELGERGREGGAVPALARSLSLDEPTILAALSGLRRAGRADEFGGRWFAESVIEEAHKVAVASWSVSERTLGDLRAAWGVNRRSAEALAKLLDARGVTQRRGATRVLRRGASRAGRAEGG